MVIYTALKRAPLHPTTNSCDRFVKEMTDTIICSHPLIKHKITLLRDKNISSHKFRKLLREITFFIGYLFSSLLSPPLSFRRIPISHITHGPVAMACFWNSYEATAHFPLKDKTVEVRSIEPCCMSARCQPRGRAPVIISMPTVCRAWALLLAL